MVTATKKKSKKASNVNSKKTFKHSEQLNLSGPVPDEIKNIKILKNLMPPTNRWGGGKWDHLIVRMEEGDCIELETKLAAAFGNRCRHLGYVIVLRKHTEDITRVWFEGLDPNFIPKKKVQ
jgi:hypothetical protein